MLVAASCKERLGSVTEGKQDLSLLVQSDNHKSAQAVLPHVSSRVEGISVT